MLPISLLYSRLLQSSQDGRSDADTPRVVVVERVVFVDDGTDGCCHYFLLSCTCGKRASREFFKNHTNEDEHA